MNPTDPNPEPTCLNGGEHSWENTISGTYCRHCDEYAGKPTWGPDSFED